MILPNVVSFLSDLPYAHISSDGAQLLIRCPFCGDSDKHHDTTHFSIKIDVDEKEAMVYQCFQPSYKCGVTGILTSDTLQILGCTSMATLLELSKHNSIIGRKKGSDFTYKNNKDYSILNLHSKNNDIKLDYIRKRLGKKITYKDLLELKISLGLYDFINNNEIKKLAFKQTYCDVLDKGTIGFLSMYSDYLILRDITKDMITKKRYTLYRIRGEASPDDTKIYTIPTSIDLLSPKPTIINIAEGTFSILGAYLNTDIYRSNDNNQIFTANCGLGYSNNINHLIKQYGLTNLIINIYSDSEVPYHKYKKMYSILKTKAKIQEFNIIYNDRKEDFGYPKNDIRPIIVPLTK